MCVWFMESLSDYFLHVFGSFDLVVSAEVLAYGVHILCAQPPTMFDGSISDPFANVLDMVLKKGE